MFWFFCWENDENADKADSVMNMKDQSALFTSANALRKSVKQKEVNLSKIVKEPEDKENSR